MQAIWCKDLGWPKNLKVQPQLFSLLGFALSTGHWASSFLFSISACLLSGCRILPDRQGQTDWGERLSVHQTGRRDNGDYYTPLSPVFFHFLLLASSVVCVLVSKVFR